MNKAQVRFDSKKEKFVVVEIRNGVEIIIKECMTYTEADIERNNLLKQKIILG